MYNAYQKNSEQFLAPFGDEYIINDNPYTQASLLKSGGRQFTNSDLKSVITRSSFRAFNPDGTNKTSPEALEQLVQQKAQDQDFGVTEADIPMEARGAEASPSRVVAQNLWRVKSRGQMVAGNQRSWEGGVDAFFSYVPIVATASRTIQKQSQNRMVTFVAVYSSFEPMWSLDNDAGLLVEKPEFFDFTVNQNEDLSKQYEVKIDKNMLGDTSFNASLVATINNFNPRPNSYFSCFPYGPNEQYMPNGWFGNPSQRSLSGASAGMSFAMAILGASPFYYTGYLENLLSGTKMMSNYGAIQQARQTQSEAFPDGYVAFPKTGYESYEFDPQAFIVKQKEKVDTNLVKVVKQLNFVEKVDSIVYKMAMCSRAGAPFIFPAVTAAHQNMAQFIYESENRRQLVGWLNMMPDIYSLADAQDGTSIVGKLSNGSEVMKTNCIGVTVDDFTTLQALALMGIFEVRRNAQDMEQGGMAQNWSDRFQSGLNFWMGETATNANINQKRLSEYRNKLKDTKQDYIARGMTEKQWQDEEERQRQAYAEKSKERREAKKKPKKARTAAKKEGSEILKLKKAAAKKLIDQMKIQVNWLQATKSDKKRAKKQSDAMFKTLKELKEPSKAKVLAVFAPVLQEAVQRARAGLSLGWISALSARYENVVQAMVGGGISREKAENIAQGLGFHDRAYWMARYEAQKRAREAAAQNQTLNEDQSPAVLTTTTTVTPAQQAQRLADLEQQMQTDGAGTRTVPRQNRVLTLGRRDRSGVPSAVAVGDDDTEPDQDLTDMDQDDDAAQGGENNARGQFGRNKSAGQFGRNKSAGQFGRNKSAGQFGASTRNGHRNPKNDAFGLFGPIKGAVQGAVGNVLEQLF